MLQSTCPSFTAQLTLVARALLTDSALVVALAETLVPPTQCNIMESLLETIYEKVSFHCACQRDGIVNEQLKQLCLINPAVEK